MKCNIITRKGTIEEVLCYKTEYKNIVITKVSGSYTITHYQTGMSLTDEIFRTKKDAIQAIPGKIGIVKKSVSNIKQFCKQRNIKQINF